MVVRIAAVKRDCARDKSNNDPPRRAMIQRLAHGPASTGQLAALFPISRPAVSQHLRLLRLSGLVRPSAPRRGAANMLDPEPLVLVERWARDQVDRWQHMSSSQAFDSKEMTS